MKNCSTLAAAAAAVGNRSHSGVRRRRKKKKGQRDLQSEHVGFSQKKKKGSNSSLLSLFGRAIIAEPSGRRECTMKSRRADSFLPRALTSIASLTCICHRHTHARPQNICVYICVCMCVRVHATTACYSM